jgi:predicted aspartyl protease
VDSKNIVLLLGAALLVSVTWREADGRVRVPLASNEMAVEVMAVEVYDGYLLVARGSANGVTNLRFLLDTGATDTAIDRGLAEKLGLRSRPTKVTSFDKTVESEWTGLREITFGPERASNVRVIIEDLSYFERVGVHLDGVIGLDQLRRQSFVVNYAKRCVVLGFPVTAGMRATPMLVNDEGIRVEAELAGRPVWMLADTGAPLTVLYEDTLKDLAVSYRLEGRRGWLSLSGHVESRIAMVPRFRAGGQDLGREVLLVSVPGAKRLSGISGYLGVASLEAQEVAFDFERNQFLWRK